MTADAITRIVPVTRTDFDVFCTIDGTEEYLGSRSTRAAAEKLARDYRYDYYNDTCTYDKAAAVVLEVIEEGV